MQIPLCSVRIAGALNEEMIDLSLKLICNEKHMHRVQPGSEKNIYAGPNNIQPVHAAAIHGVYELCQGGGH